MSVEQIIASLPDKTAEACERIRQNALRLRSQGTPQQREDAERLLDALAALEEPGDATPYDHLSPEEVAQRIKRAFTRRPMTAVEEKCIRALLNNPHAPSEDLSRACGWNGVIWQVYFGSMCRDRLADLWPVEGGTQSWGKPFFSGLFATFDRDGSRFTFRPEVQAGLAALGLHPAPGPSPDQGQDS